MLDEELALMDQDSEQVGQENLILTEKKTKNPDELHYNLLWLN